MTRLIRDEADLQAIEVDGLDAFLPAASPAALLRRAARLWPDAPAIHYLPGGGRPVDTVSFAELWQRVCQAARLFQRLGAGPGRAVALVAPHTLWAQVALWGAELAGLAWPINPVLSPDSITGLLLASNARVAVVLGINGELDVWAHVALAVRAAGAGIILLDLDGDGPSPGRDGSFEDWVRAEPDCDLLDPDPLADASLYPTGGTTGAPKLTRHFHRNEAFVAAAAARMYDLQPGEVMLNGFPLFHVAGAFVYGLSAIAAGAAQLVPGRMGMRNRAFMAALWAETERHGVSVLAVVATILSGLLSGPTPTAATGIRVAYTGGSVLPTELADAFEARMGIPVRNILGMTECSGMLAAEPFHAPRTPGSTGLRLPFTSLSIEDPATSACLGAGETGIVVTRGPHVSPGYLGRSAPNDTFRVDGSLWSGDLGRQDAGGRLFVSGRSKDVIIRGSHNIDPAAIEDALLQHPGVAIAAAVGLPDTYAGELPSVFVMLKPHATATEAELAAFAAARVSDPAARPKQVWIITDMPLTPVGKVFKPVLRAEAARHAVAAALSGHIPPGSVEDAGPGEVLVRVDGLTPALEAAMRAAVTGMPLAIRFVPA